MDRWARRLAGIAALCVSVAAAGFLMPKVLGPGPALAQCCPTIDFPPPGGKFPAGPGTGGKGASTAVVDPEKIDGKFTTIQAAINAVAPGGTVLIKPRRESLPYATNPGAYPADYPVVGYAESLVIKKPVRLRSFYPDSKVVLTPPAGQSCISVKPGREGLVSVSDFIIEQKGASAPACITVDSGTFAMERTVLRGAPTATALSILGGYTRIEQNTIERAATGIAVSYNYGSDHVITRNIVARNGTGLKVLGPVKLNVLNNAFCQNREDGIALADGAGAFSGNSIYSNGGSGVSMTRGSFLPAVLDNTITTNTKAGITLAPGATGRIGGNTIYNNIGKAIVGKESTPTIIYDPLNIVYGNPGDKKKKAPRGLRGATPILLPCGL